MGESVFTRTALSVFAFALVCATGMPASAFELAPYKDRLFSYPGILQPDGDSSYTIVDYREARDIDARDEVPERRVWSRYVSLKVRRQQEERTIDTPAGSLKHYIVGQPQRARVMTFYLHGKGGNRKQGVNDHTFGGNFNRLKNLMVRNGGLYVSPDIPSFDVTGAVAIASLIDHYGKLSPSARIVVACGSLGGEICYRLAADGKFATRISGYVLLGAPPVTSILSSPAFRARTPIVLAHGSRDSVYSIDSVEAHFRRMKAARTGYPVRFVRFETGTHGTPIRMIDWRNVLNWMLSEIHRQG